MFVLIFTAVISVYVVETRPSNRFIVQHPRWQLKMKAEQTTFLKSFADRSPSLHRKRYRCIVCAVTRNEWYIQEFVVRHLLIGFSHVVLYDNNRIWRGVDHDIKDLLKPYEDFGLLTRIPIGQRDVGLAPNSVINERKILCLKDFSDKADWIFLADSDEILYVEWKGKFTNSLIPLLEEAEMRNVYGMLIPWSMMYGEQKTTILQELSTQLESYPRYNRASHFEFKVLAMPSQCEFVRIPHGVVCRSGKVLQAVNHSIAHLSTFATVGIAHYYSRTTEWWLNKRDQSVPPYYNLMESYSDKKCDLSKFPFSAQYVTTVRKAMMVAKLHSGDEYCPLSKGRHLKSQEHIKINKADDDLANFMRSKINLRLIFDPFLYRSKNSHVSLACDELHHFISYGYRMKPHLRDFYFRHLH